MVFTSEPWISTCLSSSSWWRVHSRSQSIGKLTTVFVLPPYIAHSFPLVGTRSLEKDWFSFYASSLYFHLTNFQLKCQQAFWTSIKPSIHNYRCTCINIICEVEFTSFRKVYQGTRSDLGRQLNQAFSLKSVVRAGAARSFSPPY